MTLVPDEERERRFEALREADTVTDAADELGMSVPGLIRWGQDHYPRYDEEFGRPRRRTWDTVPVSHVERSLEGLRDRIASFPRIPHLSHQQRKALDGLRADVEHVLDLIDGQEGSS